MRKINKKKRSFSIKKFFKKILVAMVLTVVFACVLFIIYAFREGIVQQKFDIAYRAYTNVVRFVGFKVPENIPVSGRVRTDLDEVKRALSLSDETVITRLNLQQMQENLKQLPWVKQATVVRKLPNILEIHLTEREPIALFQQKNHYHPIDEDGNLVLVDEGNTDEWIIIVGKNAPKQAPALIAALNHLTEQSGIDIKDRVMGAALIDERRWDLYIDDLVDGLVVELPEGDLAKSLNRLVELQKKHHILDKQIKKLDLRFEGKQYITPITRDSILKPISAKEKK